jgi:hypothetical protein
LSSAKAKLTIPFGDANAKAQFYAFEFQRQPQGVQYAIDAIGSLFRPEDVLRLCGTDLTTANACLQLHALPTNLF